LINIKHITALILLMLSLHFGSEGQERISSTFLIRELPNNGIELNQGWKFFAGDNPEFAKKDFDESNWANIDPTGDSLKLISEAPRGIYWMRLRFSIDSTLLREQLAALINQYLASELYINGKLLYRFGTIQTDPKKIIAYNPYNFPVSIPVDNQTEQVWAIRYSFQPGVNYLKEGAAEYPLFKARLLPTNSAFREVKKYERKLPVTNTFRVGAFFILAILHLVFFLFNSSQKAYLYFFVYAVFMITSDIMQFNVPNALKPAFLHLTLVNLFWRLSSLWLLAALYTLLNQKKTWIFWGLVVLGTLTIFNSNWNVSAFLIDTLINIELVRTGLKASKLNIKGSWIITVGAINFLVFGILFNAGVYFQAAYWFWPLGETYIFADIIYALATLSIPVATTLYIALNFAFTSRSLEQKLQEVNILSRKTLEQEKEKQQILEQVNVNLEKQVAERTRDLQKSLSDLKSTQSQLIQQEKMASLGELTAGIAHEIQNPLNFVKNFSEVNMELAEEITKAMDKGDLEELKILVADFRSNQEKIHEHGNRAEQIVKNMLQHSRTASGIKEPTDLNALADEYLRLAFHGFRAKEKNFQCNYTFQPDPNVGHPTVVPQDIGRVLLNLFNNAFYAVDEKKKQIGDGFEPEVTVSTRRVSSSENRSNLQSGSLVMITVKDNGKGISDKIKDKIFQPFFTTKPTGQGTGLGLSLSYDIVKAHGGDLRLETKEGEGTEFIILLPVS
jgi:two-component system NtrC family sensor kinase